MCPGRGHGAGGARSSTVGPARAGHDRQPTPGRGHKGMNPLRREPCFPSAAVHQGRQELRACPEAGTSLGSRASRPGRAPKEITPLHEKEISDLVCSCGRRSPVPKGFTLCTRTRADPGAAEDSSPGAIAELGTPSARPSKPGGLEGRFCLESTAAHPPGSCPGGCTLQACRRSPVPRPPSLQRGALHHQQGRAHVHVHRRRACSSHRVLRGP